MEAKNNYVVCKEVTNENKESFFEVSSLDRYKELEVISCGTTDLKPKDRIIVPTQAIDLMELDGKKYSIVKVGNVILVK